jgi:hypothetical protein
MDRFETLFNLVEGAFWSLIALGMAVGAFRHAGKRRRLLSIAAAAFALFGISDWIEAETGSWWEPWWLLVLKVGCVAVLILVLRKWYELARTERS